jgi:hypothetical protein
MEFYYSIFIHAYEVHLLYSPPHPLLSLFHVLLVLTAELSSILYSCPSFSSSSSSFLGVVSVCEKKRDIYLSQSGLFCLTQ